VILRVLWHDNKVYSISSPDRQSEITVDIDFIVEWVKEGENNGYKFLVAPAILKSGKCFSRPCWCCLPTSFQDLLNH